jgi:WhiB family redox-sensing transcriptional regulator
MWFLQGACRGADPQLFFMPDGGEPEALREVRETCAKDYCARCPVRQACLEWSIDVGERFGIWGGLNEEERAHLRRIPAPVRRAEMYGRSEAALDDQVAVGAR